MNNDVEIRRQLKNGEITLQEFEDELFPEQFVFEDSLNLIIENNSIFKFFKRFFL